MNFEIKDNSDKVEKELHKSLLVALEKCGLLAEGYAKKLCPVDTGRLRNSIAHAVYFSFCTLFSIISTITRYNKT